MTHQKSGSGRYSRFPAVNRGGAPVPAAAPAPAPVAPPVEAVEPEPVVEENPQPEVEVEAVAPEEEAVEVPDTNVDDLLAWAGDDEDRRAAALAAENSRTDPRKTVLRELDPNFGG